MAVKPKNVFFILLLLPVAILFQSLTEKEVRADGCSESILKSAGPPPCYSNDPPTNTNCATSCHMDWAPNTGTAQVALDLGAANSGYVPGQTYTVSMSITKAGMALSGFQIIALEDNNIAISPGIVTLTNSTRTQVIDAAHPHTPYPCGNELTKTWIEHTASGINNISSGYNSWSYAWQAPAIDVGSITFYLAAVEANNDLDNTGDYVYTLTKTITALTPVEDITGRSNLVEIYPHPSRGECMIKTTGSYPKEFSVYDVSGKLTEKFNSSTEIVKLDLKKYSKGIYFLKIRNDNVLSVDKLIIQ